MPDAPAAWSQLSASSRRAFEHAVRARSVVAGVQAPSGKGDELTAPAPVDPMALLAGIVAAQSPNSEPEQLLAHAGMKPDGLDEAAADVGARWVDPSLLRPHAPLSDLPALDADTGSTPRTHG
jgi:hypothetical protein